MGEEEGEEDDEASLPEGFFNDEPFSIVDFISKITRIARKFIADVTTKYSPILEKYSFSLTFACLYSCVESINDSYRTCIVNNLLQLLGQCTEGIYTKRHY